MQAAAEQWFFEGNRHLASGDAAHAEACFRRAVSLSPMLAEAHANLGWLLDEAGERDEAEAFYRRALAINASQLQIHLNYGAFLARLQRFDEAERRYAAAIAIEPSSAPAWSNLGALYAQMGRLEDGEVCCRKSLALDPGYAKAHINLSYLCLRQGRFEEGLQHYEWRTWQFGLQTRVDCPRWDGRPMVGKSILVGHEGGHGDVIQFSRYVTRLKSQGVGRVTLLSPPALRSLLESLEGVDEVLASDQPLPRTGWDCWTSMMSLPHHCGTRVDSIPAQWPYLSPDEGKLATWRLRLPDKGLRVGLVWKGSANFENDADRSLPSLHVLAALGLVQGVEFVSLQKGQGEEEAVHPDRPFPMTHLGTDIETFADTAAIVASLDLVICVDTAVAHLAGSLGTPCWVLLPCHMPDWRWLDRRRDSPWYPDVMRLFRQTTRGDWAGAVTEVRLALEQFVIEAEALR
jgi:Tfp pilus assembly protein PilF